MKVASSNPMNAMNPSTVLLVNTVLKEERNILKEYMFSEDLFSALFVGGVGGLDVLQNRRQKTKLNAEGAAYTILRYLILLTSFPAITGDNMEENIADAGVIKVIKAVLRIRSDSANQV